MIKTEECPIEPEHPNVIRCTRRRPDGTLFAFGALLFDPTASTFRVEPAVGDASDQTHGTMGEAMDELLQRNVSFYRDRLIQLMDQARITRETLELLGEVPD